ncbi:MAG TPA: branched-chain amino acid ABC transporter permease [Actinomycetota bacterium]
MQTLVVGISVGAIYGLLALGIVLVYKTTRVLNFAQGELGTFAVYIAWALITKSDWPWAAGALAAIFAVTAIGLAFERFVIRPNVDAPRLTLVIATVGLGLALYGLEVGIWGLSPQLLAPPVTGCGLDLANVCVPPVRLFAMGTTLALGLGLLLLLKRTTFGLGVLAAAHDPTTVRLMGVRLSHISMFAWGSAAALAALSGLILLPAIGTFTPFALTLFFLRGLAAALLGGLTSLTGAFIGGIAIGVLEAGLQNAFPTASGIVEAGLFGVVLAVLLLRPRGILGSTA